MKKFYISMVSILFLSFYCIPSAFCELDPELKAYSQKVVDHNKDYFVAIGFAGGLNKLTSKTKLGITIAPHVEVGFFEQIGAYNSFHLGLEYAFLKNTYESDTFEDEMIIPVRFLVKVGYGFIFSERVSLYLDSGIGPAVGKQKRTLKEDRSTNTSARSLGLGLHLAVNINIKLHGALSLNTGFRADLISITPPEYKINNEDQVKDKSTTTIAYSMNAGLKISL